MTVISERQAIEMMTTELRSRNERIKQLEHLNATLAAEVDRMRPINEIAYALFFIIKDINADSLTEYERGFVERMQRAYEAAKREGGDGN